MAEVLVIGGGAAGMMAAWAAARAGARVTLIEHNEKLGKKVYITGKGRCNLTNDCGVDEFLAQVPRNPRFLYSALNRFGPRDMMALLESAGCPVTVQRGRRVFPASEKASDVTKAMTALMKAEGVRVRLNTGLEALRFQETEDTDTEAAAERNAKARFSGETDFVRERVSEAVTKPSSGQNGRREQRFTGERIVTGALLTDGSFLRADAVVLAMGGWSYPATGSTGDGYRIAREAGYTVTPPSPVLVGIETLEAWPRGLQGLSLKNVRLSLKNGRKTVWTELGEMLFTHFGVSGPLVLEASCHLPEDPKKAELEIDFKPGLSPEQLDARLRRDFAADGRKRLSTVLGGLLPGRLAEVFPSLCGVAGEICCSQVSGAQRENVARALKGLTIGIRSPRPIEEAVVTRGGVSVRQVDPGTMAGKLHRNLYFAGEMLDVDAHTGGYNLQIAWSTGFVAGEAAARLMI